MPSRNRAREAAKAAAGQSSTGRKKTGRTRGKGGKAKGGGNKGPKRQDLGSTAQPGRPPTAPPKRPRTGPMLDPSAADDAETRFVQPYEATKIYVCPGCNRDIPPGVGHLVAVPPDEPDLRRHWHRGCWHNRHTRF